MGVYKKLQGAKGTEVEEDVHARFGGSTPTSSVETVQTDGSPPAKKDVPPQENWRLWRKSRRVLKFSADEDDFLKEGITKHGFGQWTAILRDPDFKFQDGRVADSLKKGLNSSSRKKTKSVAKLHYCGWNIVLFGKSRDR